MPQDKYDKIMMLAKRRGFIYPSFEIYGGSAGFYDYGPLGSRLKQNIENLFRKYYLLKDKAVEISTPTITLYEVLKASGHVEEFTDLTVDCDQCKTSFKVEDIIEDDSSIQQALSSDQVICPTCGNHLNDAYPVNLMFATKIGIGRTRDAFLRPETAQGIFTGFHLLYRYGREKLPLSVIQIGKGYRNEVSPRQGPIRMREFSMMEAEVFFDPENKNHDCFDDVKDEILFLFDNVNEMKISLAEAVDADIVNNQALAYYMYLTQSFLLEAGVDPEKFRFRKHADDELAHYAQECWDAELFSERFGWVECVGIADRSAYDLSAHINASNTDMYALRRYEKAKEVKKNIIEPNMAVLGPRFKGKAGKIQKALENINPEDIDNHSIEVDGEQITLDDDCYQIVESIEKVPGEKFVPHVIEPSYGLDRIFYCILEHNFMEIEKKGESYRLMTLSPSMAPIKTGVFPLINDTQLTSLAKQVDVSLREHGLLTYYDDGGTIGRRYARMDEIGTPFCITIDPDSIKDNTVTVRDRDTTEQKRIAISELSDYLLSVITKEKK
ncbi:MAG: glycine--tRNA ligase [Thermoplasmatota archaeon]